MGSVLMEALTEVLIVLLLFGFMALGANGLLG